MSAVAVGASNIMRHLSVFGGRFVYVDVVRGFRAVGPLSFWGNVRQFCTDVIPEVDLLKVTIGRSFHYLIGYF